MSRNSQLSLLYKQVVIVLVAGSFLVIQASTFDNQTYINVFERGLSYPGNDIASEEFQIPESLELRNFRNSKRKQRHHAESEHYLEFGVGIC